MYMYKETIMRLNELTVGMKVATTMVLTDQYGRCVFPVGHVGIITAVLPLDDGACVDFGPRYSDNRFMKAASLVIAQ